MTAGIQYKNELRSNTVSASRDLLLSVSLRLPTTHESDPDPDVGMVLEERAKQNVKQTSGESKKKTRCHGCHYELKTFGLVHPHQLS